MGKYHKESLVEITLEAVWVAVLSWHYVINKLECFLYLGISETLNVRTCEVVRIYMKDSISQAQTIEMAEPDHWASNTNDTVDNNNGEEGKPAEDAGQ